MMKSNIFTISLPKTNRSICWTCHKEILKEDLRVKLKSSYHYEHYHLLCFRPKLFQFIFRDKLKIYLDKHSNVILNDWLDNWNSQFRAPEGLDVRFRVFKKSLNSIHIKNRRIWLEVFKFLPGIEIIKNISETCKTFYEISWSNELFRDICMKEFGKEWSGKCFRSLFICLYEESCFKCHSLDKNLKFKRVQHTQRNKCQRCNENYLTAGEIRQKFRMASKNLGIKPMNCRYSCKKFEGFWVKKAIIRMRKRKKERVFKYFNRNCRSALQVIKLLDLLNLWEIKLDLSTIEALEVDEWKKIVLRVSANFLHLNEEKMFMKDLLRVYKENCPIYQISEIDSKKNVMV